MNIKQYIPYALIVPVVVLAAAGASIASAHGWFMQLSPEDVALHHEQMFTQKAELLGVSVEEVKNAWAQGKTLAELAREKGISEEQLKERMHSAHKAKMQQHLKALVDQGVITQTQADQRLAVMEERMQEAPLHGKGKRFHPGMMW